MMHGQTNITSRYALNYTGFPRKASSLKCVKRIGKETDNIDDGVCLKNIAKDTGKC